MDTTQTNLLRAVTDSENQKAWTEFYRVYSPMLRQFARRLGLFESEVDDLLQDVLMIAQESLRENVYQRSRGGFRQWLYGVARRRALTTLRQRRRRTRVQAVSLDHHGDPLSLLEDRSGEAAAENIWNQEWRYALMDEALRHVEGEIGGKAFEAFRRFAIERQPAEEVARSLGIAAASVYVYRGRVLELVREWIQRHEADEDRAP